MKPSAIHHLPIPLRISEVEFCSWLSQAASGDVLEYHRGFLAADRMPFGNPMVPETREELVRTSACVMRLAERGFVHLVQRRLGADRFSYLAIARPRPGRTPIPFATLMTEEAA